MSIEKYRCGLMYSEIYIHFMNVYMFNDNLCLF